MHIWNHYRSLSIHCGPAYALTFLQLLARHRALVRSHHQAAFTVQVKSSPEVVIHFVVQHGTDGCHARQGLIGFSGQLLKLMINALVSSRFFTIFHASMNFGP